MTGAQLIMSKSRPVLALDFSSSGNNHASRSTGSSGSSGSSGPTGHRPYTIPLSSVSDRTTMHPSNNTSSTSPPRTAPSGSGVGTTSEAPFNKNKYYSHYELSTAASPPDIERLKSKSMDEIGILKTSSNEVYDFGMKDLLDLGQIGSGSYGTVNKMLHSKSKSLMAVKLIRVSVNEDEQRQVKMDLGVIRRASYKHIVTFYGAIFYEGDCWICMELMDLSAELLYRYVHQSLHSVIPESNIAQIALATVNALKYLQENLGIIHRDVKPSNILLSHDGKIKLCDFGISGVLIDSIARTHDVGCRPYMAPERIDPTCERDGYDVRSDVWSMGISLIEISTGSFPYQTWTSVFEQLQLVVNGPPPLLKDCDRIIFSDSYHAFIESCLKKEARERPKYNALLKTPFLRRALHEEATVDMAEYVSGLLERTKEIPLPDGDDGTLPLS